MSVAALAAPPTVARPRRAPPTTRPVVRNATQRVRDFRQRQKLGLNLFYFEAKAGEVERFLVDCALLEPQQVTDGEAVYDALGRYFEFMTEECIPRTAPPTERPAPRVVRDGARRMRDYRFRLKNNLNLFYFEAKANVIEQCLVDAGFLKPELVTDGEAVFDALGRYFEFITET